MGQQRRDAIQYLYTFSCYSGSSNTASWHDCTIFCLQTADNELTLDDYCIRAGQLNSTAPSNDPSLHQRETHLVPSFFLDVCKSANGTYLHNTAHRQDYQESVQLIQTVTSIKDLGAHPTYGPRPRQRSRIVRHAD